MGGPQGPANDTLQDITEANHVAEERHVLSPPSPAESTGIDQPELVNGSQHALSDYDHCSTTSTSEDICRICHSGPTIGQSLLSPCQCIGSVQYSHPRCLAKWINFSNKRRCELCHTRYKMVMSGMKPIHKWRCISMNCTVFLHVLLFITCVIVIFGSASWWLYVNLVDSPFTRVYRTPGMKILLYAAYVPLDIICLILALLELKYVICPVIQKWITLNRRITIRPHSKATKRSTPTKRGHKSPTWISSSSSSDLAATTSGIQLIMSDGLEEGQEPASAMSQQGQTTSTSRRQRTAKVDETLGAGSTRPSNSTSSSGKYRARKKRVSRNADLKKQTLLRRQAIVNEMMLEQGQDKLDLSQTADRQECHGVRGEENNPLPLSLTAGQASVRSNSLSKICENYFGESNFSNDSVD